jgi:hypothetical protein
MKITEILNKKIEYEVVKSTNTIFHTRAKIANRIINFSAILEDDSDGSWELAFNEKNEQGKISYSQTGHGGELEVFSMVKDSIIEFITRYQPEKMYFTADKDNKNNARADVYERLIKRFNIPGYSYKRNSETNNSEKFTLIKN